MQEDGQASPEQAAGQVQQASGGQDHCIRRHRADGSHHADLRPSTGMRDGITRMMMITVQPRHLDEACPAQLKLTLEVGLDRWDASAQA